MRKLILTQLFFIFILFTINAQVLVNQIWTTSSGTPKQDDFLISQWNEIDWESSALTSNGELVTVGNTLQSPNNTDILVTKYSNSGQVVWEQTFAGSAGFFDYGLAISIDNTGNILVAGVVTTNNQTTDVIVLKYTDSGTLLWSNTGGGNNFEVPTSLTSDANGNIYVVGGKYTPVSQTDWFISKLNSAGTLQWTSIYNYADLHDLAIDVQVIGGNIKVSGFSGSTQSTWDFAELSFSEQNGSLLSENRKTIPNISIEKALLAASDDQNNIYIAGSTTLNPTNAGTDIQLVKINSAFEIEWVRTIDGEGLDDKAKALKIDNAGNIIVAGNSKKSNNGIQITISKFAPNGDEFFRNSYLAPVTYEAARVSKMQITVDNDILLTGSVDRNGNKDFVTIMYDENGILRFEKFYSGEGHSNDVAKSLEVSSSGEVFVTGKEEGNQSKYTTVKYEIVKRSDEIVSVGGTPHHRANELIVKFNPSFVNTDFVNDKKTRFGTIDEILNIEATAAINASIDLQGAKVVKVFPRLTTGHTTSTTRLGETIPIPEFWSVFLILLKEGQEVDKFIDEFEAMSDYVVYAHPNHVYEYHNIPNDEFFETGGQSSLFPSPAFQNAHINVEPAWDIETGENWTRVGVYDSEIFWAHDDFGDGTFEGSQIAGGFDYVDNVDIMEISNTNNSHGTACAGIIGALRDNNMGIAGIAGGGEDAQGAINSGVSLYSMAISEGGNYLTGTEIFPAIVDGAMFVPEEENSGFGLHIMNASWGGQFISTSLSDAVLFTYRNQVLFVASKGNGGSGLFFTPADINDDWVLSVGASGTDGEYKNAGNGDAFISTAGCIQWASNFGNGVDLVAPGVTELVTTLIDPGALFSFITNANCTTPGLEIWPAPLGESNDYQVFNGTSAAAPHVVGVAALMHSLHNINNGQSNDLAPEDFEFLIQRYADDIAGGVLNYPIGYDNFNGWGRLNAFEVVRRVEGPQWQVYHNTEPDKTDIELIASYPHPFAPAPLIINKYLVTHKYFDVFPESVEIIDAWPRGSSAIGGNNINYDWDNQNPFYDPIFQDVEFSISGNTAEVTVSIFYFELVNVQTGEIEDVSPAPFDQLRTAYSLHLFDAKITDIERINDIGQISVFPNPNNGKFKTTFDLPESKVISIQIIDISGKVIIEEFISNPQDESFLFDLSNVSNGVYLCRLLTDQGTITKRIIKN